MLNSLYNDLPEAKRHATEEKKVGGAGWSLSKQMTPAQRSGASGLPPPSVLRAAGRGRGRGPPPAGRGRGPGPVPSNSRPVLDPLGQTAVAPSAVAVNSLLGVAVTDEYDPARPNDYEQVRAARERQRIETEQEAERLRQLEWQQEEQARMQEIRAREEAAVAEAAARAAEAVAARVSSEEERRAALALSGEEAFARRGRISGFSDGPAPEPAQPVAAPEPPGGSGNGGMTFAQKMMEKMGWREGQGLGRLRQGMTTPLVAQKTDARSAVIVSANPTGPGQARTGTALSGPPTKVVLLRNMVGPGEVDDDLEDEVGQECSRYGSVASVLIFEVTTPGFPHEQAVRIFVEFEREEAATKALVDLGGRFFGGRQVNATFFDEERYAKNELAPRPEELTD